MVDKVHEIVSFKQSNWLEKYRNFSTQKTNMAKTDSQKDSHRPLKNAFYGKTVENVRNRLRLKFHKKDDYKKIKQQFKLTFNVIHNSMKVMIVILSYKTKFLWIKQIT